MPPTNQPASISSSLAFVGRAGAWALLLFGLVRVPWFQSGVLLPFATLQGRIGCALVGTDPKSVVIGLSCTGADPMALVLAAVLAFPAPWRARLKGAAIGLALILLLNTVRIGTLSLVVSRRELFNALHVYVWPAVLIIVAAAYVFRWMARAPRSAAREPALPRADFAFSGGRTRTFWLLLVLLVPAFFAVLPWLLRSQLVLTLAHWATVSAAGIMAALGVSAEVQGNLLRTPHGNWVVTQACVATPLLPVYLAAALALPATIGRRALAAAVSLPLFMALGSARLLVLALPAALVGSHTTAVHAFYQVLAAVVVVVGCGLRAPDRAVTLLRSLAAGLACWIVIGAASRAWFRPVAERLSASLHLGHAWSDAQGALAILVPFQMALFAALWLALRRPLRDRLFGIGIAALAVFQIAVLVAVGEMAVHAGVELPIALLRAAALAAPLLVVWWTSGAARRTFEPNSAAVRADQFS